MSLDGITTHFLSQELSTILRGGRIDKVYQPTRYEMILHIRSGSENFRLLLSANPSGPRIHLCNYNRENPALPPQFCMLLRKYLSGARIVDISSPGYERIVEIIVESTNELGDRVNKRLIIEMMGRYSNIILVGEGNRVHDSLVHVDSQMSRIREIMPARIYEYPKDQGKLSPQDAMQMLSNNLLPVLDSCMHRPLEKALQESLLGFSPALAREICYLADTDVRMGLHQLPDSKYEAVLHATRSILTSIIDQKISPSAFSPEEGFPPTDFHALPLKDAGYITCYPLISAAMDAVYHQKDITFAFEQEKNELRTYCQTSLSHALRKQQIHISDMDECQGLELLQKSGQLLLANVYQIPKNATHYQAEDYESQGGPCIDIPIDTRYSVTQNAAIYFKQAAKFKNRREVVSEFFADDNRTVDYLTSLSQAIDSAQDADDLTALRDEMRVCGLLTDNSSRQTRQSKSHESKDSRNPGKAKTGSSASRALRAAGKAASKRTKSQSKKSASSPDALHSCRKYQTPDGFTILCGRNNLQNDQLTLKTASSEDLWFHVSKMPGTHVILRAENRKPSDAAILQAAKIAAFFSKTVARSEKTRASDPRQNIDRAPRISELKIPVDYCPVKNVKKPAKAKPGMVIYEHYQTLLVSPDLPEKL